MGAGGGGKKCSVEPDRKLSTCDPPLHTGIVTQKTKSLYYSIEHVLYSITRGYFVSNSKLVMF